MMMMNMSTDHDDNTNHSNNNNNNNHHIHHDKNKNHSDDDDDIHTILQTFCTQQRQLLDCEYNMNNSSISSNSIHNSNHQYDSTSRQQRNSVLNHLVVEERSIGLYGRTVLRFVRDITIVTNATNTSTTTTTTTATTATTATNNNTTSTQSLLPAHTFTTGDDIEVKYSSSSPEEQATTTTSRKNIIMSGVICEVTDTSISVAMSSKTTTTTAIVVTSTTHHTKKHNDSNENEIIWNDPYMRFALSPKSQRIIYEKLLQTLQILSQSHSINASMVRAMFVPPRSRHSTTPTLPSMIQPPLSSSSVSSTTPPRIVLRDDTVPINDPSRNDTTTPSIPLSSIHNNNYDNNHHSPSYQNPYLDDSQKDAIRFALSSNHNNLQHPITLIHGPVTYES